MTRRRPGHSTISPCAAVVVTIDLGQLDHAQAAVAAPPGPTPHTSALPARTDTQRAAPAPGTTLTLNLFDDTVVTGLVEWTEPTFSGGYAVAGHLVEEPLGTLTLCGQRRPGGRHGPDLGRDLPHPLGG